MIVNREVEFWRAPLTEDSYGLRRDWDSAIRVITVQMSVQPVDSNESDADRETTVTELKAYAWPAPVEHGDRALIDGRWWQVDGEPDDWTFFGQAHIKVMMKAVTN